MSNTQYAVCHLQRGSGNDSGMSCHIERKDAKREKYVPVNADANRTHLNRELVAFPAGVKNRTDAIQYRIDHAGLHRKVGKNQTKAIRIILTGTHKQMMKIAKEDKLDNWIDANLKWLKNTFGSENLVSCVLHMDEKTPHLHATIVPIITTERLRKKREGEKKYATKSGARLSADDVMRRSKLHEYQNSYAAAMKPFGLQRGIVGSTAKHLANLEYYKQQINRYEEDIAKLQADIEKAHEGKNTILSWFGKGDLAKAKKELASRDEQIAKLKNQIKTLMAEKSQLKEKHRGEIEQLRNGFQKEIDKAIRMAEKADRQSKEKDSASEKYYSKYKSKFNLCGSISNKKDEKIADNYVVMGVEKFLTETKKPNSTKKLYFDIQLKDNRNIKDMVPELTKLSIEGNIAHNKGLIFTQLMQYSVWEKQQQFGSALGLF